MVHYPRMSTYPSVFDPKETATQVAAASGAKRVAEKSGKKLSIRIDPVIHSKASEIAKLENRTLTFVVNRLLSLGIRSYARMARRLLQEQGAVATAPPPTPPVSRYSIANAEKEPPATIDSEGLERQADADADYDAQALKIAWADRN
jgi:hypothetical protein